MPHVDGTPRDNDARGVENLGNTCYMNASLQMLAHSRGFIRWLTLYVRPGVPLMNEIRCVISDLWAPMGTATATATCVDPRGLVQAIRRTVRGFRVGAQSDAHEFLCDLLNALAKEGRSTPNPSISMSRSRPRSVLEAGWRSATEADGGPEAPLVQLLNGQFLHTVRCGECGKTHTSQEVFMTLPVALAARSTQGCALAHFAPEEVEGWKCDACGARTTVMRSTSAWRLPQVLILALKRFTDPTSVSRELVVPSASLDLSSVAAPGSPCSSRTKYRLSAVVCHVGLQDSGHYFACARRPQGCWFMYDDAQVAPMPGGLRDVPQHLTYLLAYEAPW